jgi:FMN-dependent NADH-azoreductase
VNQAPTVIGIIGSYREGGTIDSAVNEILSAAEAEGASTSKIWLKDQHVEFCTNCRQCMQEPGAERGKCIFENDDDMENILSEIEAADAIVVGAPVNLGNVNALTRRFMERCVGFAYWPWGTQGGPKIRNPEQPRRAVLVSSSGAPGIFNSRLFGFGAIPALKQLAGMMGAKTVGILKIGLVLNEDFKLSPDALRKAHRLAKTLVSETQ